MSIVNGKGIAYSLPSDSTLNERTDIDDKNATVHERIRKLQQKGENYNDRTVKMREFEVGDHVWECNYSKKGPKFFRAKTYRKIGLLSYRVFDLEDLNWRRHSLLHSCEQTI